MSEVTDHQMKRSLILAGGGMKVAFQAGVLQVWLDEARLDGAPLTFDHADGASGGTLNLAMYCQGMSGTQIAENWRTLDPRQGIDFNWEQYAKLLYAESLFELDRYRENIFRKHWKLDWEKISGSDKVATFNVYNFSKHELEVLTPRVMSEDYLAACVSLPMWFPPVTIGGDIYIDPVFVTDANIEEAIRRGADELWIIWTVSERGEWNDGFIANYFQIIETAANGNFKRMLKRIDENNLAIAEGKPGEFGRHIEKKLLKAEVPLHYLINLRSDRINEAVNRGVQAAREWCVEQGILLESPDDHHAEDPIKLWFTEEMKGYVTFGETNFERGFWEGRKTGTFLMSHLTIRVDDVDRFVKDPQHEALAEGYVRFEAPGGELPVSGELPVKEGRFNLFKDKEDPSRKRMLYRLHFHDNDGRPLTLSGYKEITDDPGADIWSDTTTMFTRILQGHVEPGGEANAEIVASGKLTIHLLDFLELLTTFRVDGPTTDDEASALTRFGLLFLGNLWDVYARRVLSSSPF
jgi:predicted patatin/cPLA2 family phospholipase